MPKEFLYLLQSSAERLALNLPLATRPSSDAVFLTWDKPVDGVTFLGQSTWAAGRNWLARRAREMPGYSYYVFIDDDIDFALGSFDRFEDLLRRKRPAFACPVFIPKSRFTVIGIGRGVLDQPFRGLRAQLLRRGDCQMTALHHTVLQDGLLYPLQTQFDPLSWWCTSSTLQILALNLYRSHALQFNTVAVRNLENREYVRQTGFPEQASWLARQFRRPVSRPENYSVNLLSADGLKTLARRLRGPLPRKYRFFTDWFKTVAGSLLYKSRDSYAFTPEALARVLNPESDLYRQYLRLSPNARPRPAYR